MTQLAQPPGPTEPVLRDVGVSVLGVSPLTPPVRALLREQGGLTALEAAELYGPSRLPRRYTADEARELVDALERLGIAARVEEAPPEWYEGPGPEAAPDPLAASATD